MSFSSATATATLTEIKAGVNKTDGHIAQSSWNITTTPFAGFDPTQINVYKIKFGYLGVANITYSIYNPNAGGFVDVHAIEWANANVTTHIDSPNFKVGWTSASLGSSGTNLTVEGASGALHLEGDEVLKNNTFADNNTVTGVGTSDVALLTIKNRYIYGDQFNLGKVIPLEVSVENDHTKGSVIEIWRGSSLDGVTDFEFEDEFNSIAEYEKSGSTFTGGQLISSKTVPAGGETSFDLTLLKTELLPGDLLVISGRAISGTGANLACSITWKEEK